MCSNTCSTSILTTMVHVSAYSYVQWQLQWPISLVSSQRQRACRWTEPLTSLFVVNLATNSLPFGSDLSAIFPRWMTIRRGQVLCTVLGIAIVPWKLLNSAQAFLTFRECFAILTLVLSQSTTDNF